MIVGYARVSTEDQKLDLQLSALRGAGCNRIYEDQGRSGYTFEREGLEAALESMKPGGTLVVWRLDRLGRSLSGLVQLIDQLGKRQVHFRSVMENIDTTSPGGRLMFHMMAALAEFERAVIAERTRAGLAEARARGSVIGRPKAMDEDGVRDACYALHFEGRCMREVAGQSGVSIRTLQRYLKQAYSGSKHDMQRSTPYPRDRASLHDAEDLALALAVDDRTPGDQRELVGLFDDSEFAGCDLRSRFCDVALLKRSDQVGGVTDTTIFLTDGVAPLDQRLAPSTHGIGHPMAEAGAGEVGMVQREQASVKQGRATRSDLPFRIKGRDNVDRHAAVATDIVGDGARLEVVRDEPLVGIDPFDQTGSAQCFQPPNIGIDKPLVVPVGSLAVEPGLMGMAARSINAVFHHSGDVVRASNDTVGHQREVLTQLVRRIFGDDAAGDRRIWRAVVDVKGHGIGLDAISPRRLLHGADNVTALTHIAQRRLQSIAQLPDPGSMLGGKPHIIELAEPTQPHGLVGLASQIVRIGAQGRGSDRRLFDHRAIEAREAIRIDLDHHLAVLLESGDWAEFVGFRAELSRYT